MYSVLEWAENNLGSVRRRRNSIEADCPFCGKPRHLYIHVDRGYFRCYAKDCGESGRNISKLIAAVNGVSLAEARRVLFRDSVNFIHQRKESPSAINPPTRLSVPSRVGGAMSRPGRSSSGSTEAAGAGVASPKETIPVWDGQRWRMPRYLIERGVSRRVARRYNLGYRDERLCERAPVECSFIPGEKTCVDAGVCRYANRIILPIECPNGSTFTARSVFSDESLRYLNPPTSKSRLFYGWNQVVEPEIELVLVEGPFDVIRLASHGIAAIAVMGLFLSEEQRNLLATVRFTAITIMLDAGVIEDARKIAAAVHELSPLTFIANLPVGLDPGETDKDTAWRILREATQYCGSWESSGKRLRPRIDLLMRCEV